MKDRQLNKYLMTHKLGVLINNHLNQERKLLTIFNNIKL